MEFSLSEDQAHLVRTAREFAYTELWPEAQRLDKLPSGGASFPGELVRRASELGLRTMSLPRELGGYDTGCLTEAMVMEELAVGDCGFAMTLGHPWREGHVLTQWTTLEQRERFLPAFLADDTFLTATALTEDEVGSDHGLPYADSLEAGPRTTAVLDGDEWVLNGRKRFITNGNVAGLIFVWARTDVTAPWPRGTSAFFVPSGTPGLSVGRWEDKFGLRLNQNTELVFSDCRVPAGNLIGQLHQAVRLSADSTLGGKTKEAARSIGIARSAVELATAWARLRVQGGKPIAEHDTVATTLAKATAQIELARTLNWRAAWMVDDGKDTARAHLLEDMARLYASEMAVRVVTDCVRIFGARGSLRDWPAEKLSRDAVTMMLPPIGNEAAWVRVSRALKNGAAEGEPYREVFAGRPALSLPFVPPSRGGTLG